MVDDSRLKNNAKKQVAKHSKENTKKVQNAKKIPKVKKFEKKEKSIKLPNEISQENIKEIFENLLKAIIITVYFITLNVAYSAMKEERLVKDIEIFASVFLVIGIYFVEKAYKNDSGKYTLTAIEFLVLSLHSLSIMHVITVFKYNFRFYLLTSTYIVDIYYVLKTIILYTKGKKDYLRSLSDIPEIVKKDEPIVKEARKRSNSND